MVPDSRSPPFARVVDNRMFGRNFSYDFQQSVSQNAGVSGCRHTLISWTDSKSCTVLYGVSSVLEMACWTSSQRPSGVLHTDPGVTPSKRKRRRKTWHSSEALRQFGSQESWAFPFCEGWKGFQVDMIPGHSKR